MTEQQWLTGTDPDAMLNFLRGSEEATAMKRILRTQRLTPDEAAKYKTIREQVEQELPDLIARHHARLSILEQLQELLKQWKAAE
jgi:hypothetical protein